jgi:hypothetical protein
MGGGQLQAADVLDYLHAVQVDAGDPPFQVRTAGGRNGSWTITGPDGSVRWLVKQFDLSVDGGQAFERERHAASGQVPPPVKATCIDEVSGVIVYPGAGVPILKLLQDDGPELAVQVVEKIRKALHQVRAVKSSPFPVVPPIVSDLTDEDPLVRIAPAQKRILASLREERIARTLAITCLRDWTEEETVHGDLKLEHVLIGDHGEVRIVDWEFAGPGPPDWDRASLAQGLISQTVLGVGSWSASHARLLDGVFRDADLDFPEMAPLVTLRLWQAAVEWAANRITLPREIASLVQLGLNLAQSPRLLKELILDLVAA